MNDNHNVVDIVIEDKALIECTNPKDSTFMNDKIMNDKIDYFHRKDPEHKLLWSLVVSFLVFSKEVMERILKEGIYLVVLNVRTTEENIHKVSRGLFTSTLFKLIRPFSKKYREPEPTETKPKENKLITDYTKEENPPSKTIDNYCIDNDYHLYQHSEDNKNLQVLRVIEFLVVNSSKKVFISPCWLIG